MAQFHIYNGSPTAGGTNGTKVSSRNPVYDVLDSSVPETHAAKCAIRCDSGYSIASASVYFDGSDTSLWALANDNSYANAADALANATWNSEITVTDIGTTNKIFWAKASATLNETPKDDTSVSIVVDATVSAVS